MICKQFPVCAVQLKREDRTRKSKKQSKKSRKGTGTARKEYAYTGFPCGNETRMGACVHFLDNRSKPSCTEKGKTYTLDHSETNLEVLSMHLDGGVNEGKDGRRCDYVFFVRDHVDRGQGRVILIELKGGGTRDALNQLSETLDIPEIQALGKDFKRFYGRVVNTSSPPRIQNTPAYMEVKEKLHRLGGNLKTGEWDFVEGYGELDK
ncbi:MAG: hypothetical protein K5990_07870 [Oscillospiraceae bacterium]|nr:hypothetical protein [Oscillospiraceae bacterium]